METGMNKRLTTILIILVFILLSSCQTAPPPQPITASVSDEFILRPSHTAAILGTNITLNLIAISSDERCPLDIECAMSGPVTLSISIQSAENIPAEFIMQTYTDNNGHAPEISFEGIQDRVEFGDYIIQVKAVLPYPLKRSSKINDLDYQVSFVVISK